MKMIEILPDSNFIFDMLSFGIKHAILNNDIAIIECDCDNISTNTNKATINDFWTDDDFNKDVYMPDPKKLSELRRRLDMPKPKTDNESLLNEIRRVRKRQI